MTDMTHSNPTPSPRSGEVATDEDVALLHEYFNHRDYYPGASEDRGMKWSEKAVCGLLNRLAQSEKATQFDKDVLTKPLHVKIEQLESQLADLTAKLAQYEGGVASARECVDLIVGTADTGFFIDRNKSTAIILAHTSAVVEPWRIGLSMAVSMIRSGENFCADDCRCKNCVAILGLFKEADEDTANHQVAKG